MDFLIWYSWLLTIIVLLLLINRHIIWWVWYNFFPPLIIGRAIPVLSISYERSIIIILSTILWRLWTKLTTNYVNLSLYPKYSLYLLISLWIFISMSTLYVNYTNLTALSIEVSYKLILFFLIVISTSIKTYVWWKWATSLMRWIYIWRFFAISFLISKIIWREDWYMYFSQHGTIIIVIGIFTMLIWSYTWLQLKEIIRFRKLIWNKIINKKKRI